MPPTVQKQSAVVPTKIAVSKPAPIQPGMKLALYGRAKTGKTRLACTFPKPLLLIGTEDGTKSVATGREVKATLTDTLGNQFQVFTLMLRGKSTDIDFVPTSSTSVIDHMLKIAPGKYKSCVIDHGGGLQDILVKEITGMSEAPAQMSFGVMSQQDWGILTGQFKDIMRRFLALADVYGMHQVVIAHEKNFTSENTPVDVMLPSVGAALTPQCSGWLSTAVDYLGQTYIREELTSSQAGDGGLDIPIATKTGRKQFVLRVAPHEVFQTGFRVPYDVDLPHDGIADPTFTKIQTLINS